VAELRRLYELYERDFAEVLTGLPSKADPAGVIGEDFLRERGLMGE
jgi:hypothetical protein